MLNQFFSQTIPVSCTQRANHTNQKTWENLKTQHMYHKGKPWAAFLVVHMVCLQPLFLSLKQANFSIIGCRLVKAHWYQQMTIDYWCLRFSHVRLGTNQIFQSRIFGCFLDKAHRDQQVIIDYRHSRFSYVWLGTNHISQSQVKTFFFSILPSTRCVFSYQLDICLPLSLIPADLASLSILRFSIFSIA